MATEVIPAGLGEARAASTAGGGTALTTAAVRIPLPRGTKQLTLIPRNFSTAVVCQYNINPFLTILKTTDLLATVTNITDYSENAQDLSTSTKVTLSSLDTIANGGAVYVGSYIPFGGVEIDVAATNSNASVLTVKYWDGTAWTSLSATDNTTSGGATMAIDGTVTWTMPTGTLWQSARITDITVSGTRETALRNYGLFSEEMFWTRWEVSAALDSTTDQNSWVSMNRDTTYKEIPSGMYVQQAVTVGRGGVFCVQAKTDAGTANLIVNCDTRMGGRF